MWRYDPPLRDMRFVIDEVLGAPARWAAMPAHAELDADMAAQVLEEAGRFASEILAPTNGPGDLQGCQWQDGAVTTPEGYRAAYQAFVDGGWPALACDPECGGQGLPQVLNSALFEMLAAANHGWTMYPGLLHGAYEVLHQHASGWLRETYLPKVTSGEWLSTMCLTEAHAGSDLGLLRTRAVPAEDGSYRLTGTKIFISGGDSDLTPNIVHLVLARLPEAPAGTKGLSLFLAPKFLPDGSRNAARCDGVEKKMGIKGSATCVMSFEGATGWLLGEPGKGLQAMFLMMNAARLHVGLQGLGHLEATTQNALRYTAERVQSRAPAKPEGAPAGAGGADFIVYHPAVRRQLWTLKARTESARVLSYWAAQALDEEAAHPDEAVRAAAGHRATLLTPVIKAMLTDLGHFSADRALGLWGGHGYIHEYGIEQIVRDSRIALIYEGTNEIQAIDLLLRKILPDGGQRLQGLLDWAAAQCEGSAHAGVARAGLQAVGEAVARLLAAQKADAELPFRAADDLLFALGEALLGAAWARMDAVAAQALAAGTGDSAFYAGKRQLAQLHFDWLGPELQHRLAAVAAARAPLPFLPAL
ncbi:acyl-CoA dehydrogenase family protein [Ideonella livida]|uniref:3-methylmercaptopropionyl-CoA dehydrogenase n=1 Tax=Ideonella livida TaxID=2707176 RepID=A0A7C9PJ84_9BURK|nr:acyl-CoA dehydrogenase family protein [Ideonella livida]NDY92591.1 acyl-CoA dehydrogenase [Ideonella livida]